MNQEFAEYIKSHIREYLPQDYQDANVTLGEVTKGNDRTFTGLMIRKDGEMITPTIYLEPYEAQLEKGRPLDSIMREIAQIKMDNSIDLPFNAEGIKDYETVRPLLNIRLCDPERNQEYLKGKPCTPCGELAATYRIQLMESEEGIASAVVTDDMLNLWGITPEQLHHDAVKPFKLGELCSRIRALLRRAGISHKAESTSIECGDVMIDLLGSRASLNGRILDLTSAEYRLLCLLVRNANRVVTRNIILNELWDDTGNFVDDNTLSVYVRRLREKVETDPSHPQHLITVRGFGYQWKEVSV